MSKHFVAINYIQCTPSYQERFEYLFSTRAKAIDAMPGFVDMHVLKPTKPNDPYLIVSYWESETAFQQWTKSDAFIEGHKRGFADLAQAKAEGKPVPMTSEFKVYQVLCQ